jgi:hypothetical protein
VKNKELSKRLDEEKRKLFRVEEEGKLSASRREEDLNEKEKKLSAQEEKVSRDCILLQDSLKEQRIQQLEFSEKGRDSED